MERRRYKRIYDGFKVERITGDVRYTGVIENLSEHGINMIIAPTKTPLDLNTKEIHALKLYTGTGETLNLHCRVKWAFKTLPHGLTYRTGMEIIDPPWDKSNYFL